MSEVKTTDDKTPEEEVKKDTPKVTEQPSKVGGTATVTFSVDGRNVSVKVNDITGMSPPKIMRVSKLLMRAYRNEQSISREGEMKKMVEERRAARKKVQGRIDKVNDEINKLNSADKFDQKAVQSLKTTRRRLKQQLVDIPIA